VVWRFGSRGLQLWKVEAKALEDVRRRFPGDRDTAALSLAGVQVICLRYLHDPRRAIMTGQELIAAYPRQRELCARAVLSNVRACLELDDHDQAERWLGEAEWRYADSMHYQVELRSLRRIIERSHRMSASGPPTAVPSSETGGQSEDI
jgi:hypothetical protein